MFGPWLELLLIHQQVCICVCVLHILLYCNENRSKAVCISEQNSLLQPPVPQNAFVVLNRNIVLCFAYKCVVTTNIWLLPFECNLICWWPDPFPLLHRQGLVWEEKHTYYGLLQHSPNRKVKNNRYNSVVVLSVSLLNGHAPRSPLHTSHDKTRSQKWNRHMEIHSNAVGVMPSLSGTMFASNIIRNFSN